MAFNNHHVSDKQTDENGEEIERSVAQTPQEELIISQAEQLKNKRAK